MKKEFTKKSVAFLSAAAMMFSTIGLTGCSDEDWEDWEDYDDSSLTDDVRADNNDGGNDNSSLDGSNSSSSSHVNRNSTPISKGDTEDGSFTLMLYICASDLESEGGAATADINEILYSNISDDLNIVIQTGGASEWQNSIVSSSNTQRYVATNDGLNLVDDSLGQLNMTSPNTLTDFINFSTENYPAERYALVMWDHGGGSVYGYGVDEFFSDDSLTLDEFDSALTNAGTTFSFIGFDACLMGSVETMLVASRHADYLISSENVEPGVGWYYTNWIGELSDDTTADIPTIGKTICNDFIKYADESDPTNHSTLAVYDLGYVRENLTTAFDNFLADCSTEIQTGNFNTLSAQRGRSKEVYDSTEHIDLINYASAIGTSSSDELISVLNNSMVVYDQSKNNGQYNGISMYLPFSDVSGVNTILSVNSNVTFSENYSTFMTNYANALAGGHTGGNAPSASYTDDSSYEDTSDYDWYDDSFTDEMSDYYDDNSVNSDELILSESGDGFVLELSDDDWDLITNINLCLYGYYGDSYIEYGYDEVWEFDDNGNLIVDFDFTWVALDGMVVPFYTEYSEYDDDYYYVEGSVPAEINGELYDIIIVWDSNDYPDGVIAGARSMDDESLMAEKGLYNIKAGDEVAFLCYGANSLEDEPELMYYSDVFTVEGDFEVSYEEVDEDADYEIYYMLTDIYNNYYFTESVIFE